jgi:hypothetical protein
VSRPSPEEQIQFLVLIQRLLDEGSFVATYKFALLLAIAQLSVELGDDSGAPLRLSTRQLAEHFIRLYWKQAVPYVPTGRSAPGQILKQNTGGQAAVLRELAAAHEQFASLAALTRDARRWNGLVTKVARTIHVMPLWRLQLMGREDVRFLYDRGETDREIVLKPGIAFCFRRFHALLQQLVQGAWVRFIRTIPENRTLIGEAAELTDFLFGSERASLADFYPILEEIQVGRCFYCEHPLRRRGEVDHFVPWSRYAMDLGHNFVLADAECNARKRDRLASAEHLEGWCERNIRLGAYLGERFDEKGLVHDLPASLQVARWAYSQAEDSRARVWNREDEVIELDPNWRQLPGMFES